MQYKYELAIIIIPPLKLMDGHNVNANWNSYKCSSKYSDLLEMIIK